MQGTRAKDVAHGEHVEQTRCTTPLYGGVLVHFERLVNRDIFHASVKPLGITSDNVRLSVRKIFSRERAG